MPASRALVGRRVAGALLATQLAGCLPLAEQAIPPGYAGVVDSARGSLGRNWDGGDPPTFAFVGIRCREDGGLLVFFVHQGGRHDGDLAYADHWPNTGRDNWGGAYEVVDPETDPDLRFFFAKSPEVACPPVPKDPD